MKQEDKINNILRRKAFKNIKARDAKGNDR